MNVTISAGHVSVQLSRRNLRDLLANRPGQAITRACESGVVLSVYAEDDIEHYIKRDPGPGISADYND